MDTRDFMIQTCMQERENISFEDKWPIALDIGYSSVKVFSPNTAAIFPSYAKRIMNKPFGKNPDYYMKYTDDETGEQWIVGQAAFDSLSSGDIADSETELYGRNHYFSPHFRVISRVGLALAMQTNKYGSPENKSIYIQTGLPAKYIDEDREFIKAVLGGSHSFSLQIGNSASKHFEINIKENNIYVIKQPLGTLYSACVKNNGRQTDDAEYFFTSTGLIFDPGFGTLDTFPIRSNDKDETFPDLGMRRVLDETIELIRENYGVELTIPAIQKCLKDNSVRILDRKSLSITNKPIDSFLEKANKKICEKAIEQILNSYNYLLDYNYMIITGGTGCAWEHIIRDKFKNMETLAIISGSRNNDLPMVFSNARGYFLNLCNRLVN